MTRVATKTYSIINEYRVYLTYALILGCVGMLIFYAFSMYSIVKKTVAAQKIEAQTATLSSSLQNLDAEYFSLSNKITPEMAKEYGLYESKVSAYIQRTRSLGSAIGHESIVKN